MIDLSEYKLRYTCKKTKREFYGKTLAMAQDVVLVDPDTFEKVTYTRTVLRRLFLSKKGNRGSGKSIYSRPIVGSRIPGRHSKAYREYLGKAV